VPCLSIPILQRISAERSSTPKFIPSQIITQVNDDSRRNETRQKIIPPPNPNAHPLPAQDAIHKGRKTLVLDLDETLVHSAFQPLAKSDIVFTVFL